MIAKDIMTTELVIADEKTSIKEVAKKMNETGVGSVLIMNDSQDLTGILTDRDIVVRGVASDDDINRMTCSDIMSTDVITSDANDDIDDVIDLMSDYQIKRIPIVDNEEVVGIISLGDMSQTYILEDEAGEVLNDITEGIKEYQ